MEEIVKIGTMDYTVDHTYESSNRVYAIGGISPTITCGGGSDKPKIIECIRIGGKMEELRLGNVYDDEKYTGGNFGGHVWDVNGISPTMKTGASASQQCVVEINNLTDKEGVATCLSRAEQSRAEQSRAEQSSLVQIRQATKEGLIDCQVPGIADLNYPTSKTRRGRVQGEGQISPTLTTTAIPSVLEKWIWEIDGITYLIRIRKLTPQECWRLMDFTDEDFHKAEAVNSNTQLYKQAGNSIVKNVLCEVFKQMI